MSLYEGLKDIAAIAQKADNIELYRQLLDFSSQALDLQKEVTRLTEENEQLKKRKELENVVVRHEEPVVTRSDDAIPIFYCAHCWDSEGKLIQVRCDKDGSFQCLHCNARGYYDTQKNDAYIREVEKNISRINKVRNNNGNPYLR